MRRPLIVLLAMALGMGTVAGHAQETPPPPASTRFLVLIPERIDVEWFWYRYTDTAQALVQSAVEQTLVRGGLDLADADAVLPPHASIEALLTREKAQALAAKAGAAYLITGKATAVRTSHDIAYGVQVYRSSAEVALKWIRVEDGKVLGVITTSAVEGGTSQQDAARKALKKAGREAAKQLARLLREEGFMN